ncbi:hypothetical protein AVEN_272207-1 [Araneus ventricosus]|uniref:Uncharacterized protein n=1 Tax=Araneus ventricosus TaxID=182803 RepID=A0A4Y2UUL1_ARAVE|nr:hypothetical protein AVEN_240455-1 [Araneus ventricosus]GBO16679.1 hypothetical protein AVEN_272207-1 [Araneus ventricosus]
MATLCISKQSLVSRWSCGSSLKTGRTPEPHLNLTHGSQPTRKGVRPDKGCWGRENQPQHSKDNRAQPPKQHPLNLKEGASITRKGDIVTNNIQNKYQLN